MNSAVENCYRLERNFENQEAIYIEEAVLRVRVKNIRTDPYKEVVAAVVEEVFSPRIIRDVLELASSWSEDLELSARYSEVYELLINSRAYQPTEFLFPSKPELGE